MCSNIIETPLPDVNIPLISVSKYILDKLKTYGNQTFIIEYLNDKQFSFTQLAEDILRMSNVWLSLGLKKGDIFGICGDNCYEYIVCMISGIMIGSIAIPIRGSDTTDEVSKIISERGIRMIAFSSERFRNFTNNEVLSKFKGIIFGDSFDCETHNQFSLYKNLINLSEPMDENDISEPEDVKESICLILESSGTTGLPKGCMFSHFNIISLLTIGSDIYDRNSDDIISGHSTMAHISGINQLLMSLNNGSKLVLHPKFSYDHFFAGIEKYKITALSGAASVFLKLIKSGTEYDISSLRKVICGGAPLPPGYGLRIVEKYPHIEDFRQGYGMTEMTILVTYESIGSKYYDSVGRPAPGVRIKVIDIESGQLLSHDQIGEICVTGPNLFKGYHNNLKATQECIDSDNYLHTGDVGYYDSDHRFYIVDRIKLLLKSDGLQVSPTELETIFLTHESVEEVAVIGKPDDVSGEIPTALVVIKDKYKGLIKSEDLMQFVNERITEQKRIRGGVHFVDNLPKNSFGKIARRELKDLIK